jgi:hypothetical protein
MPTLDDLPTLRTTTTVNGGDLVPVYDIDSTGATKVAALPLFGITGLQASDVASNATGSTIATRLSVVTGTTPTVTLPAVAGNLRQVIVMNTASGNATVDGAGSEQILTGTANANDITVATGKSAILLSDGTRWYHISNDA